MLGVQVNLEYKECEEGTENRREIEEGLPEIARTPLPCPRVQVRYF